MRFGEPQLVQQPLEVIHDILEARRSTTGELTAIVSQHGRDDHIVLAREQPHNIAPNTLTAENAMQQNEWLT